MSVENRNRGLLGFIYQAEWPTPKAASFHMVPDGDRRLAGQASLQARSLIPMPRRKTEKKKSHPGYFCQPRESLKL